MSVAISNPNAIAYLIPLVNVPQTFQISLNGITYTMTSRWNDMGQYWGLDIADSNNSMIVANVPLITGADCLKGLDYLGINGSLYVLTAGSMPDAVPTLDNLGVDSNLYFVSVAEQ
jgi:hypothetical protein